MLFDVWTDFHPQNKMLFHLSDLQFANNDMQFWAKPKAVLMDKTIEVLEPIPHVHLPVILQCRFFPL